MKPLEDNINILLKCIKPCMKIQSEKRLLETLGKYNKDVSWSRRMRVPVRCDWKVCWCHDYRDLA